MAGISLPPEQLQALRADYQPAMMKAATVAALGQRHPAGLPYVSGFVEHLFDETHLDAANRERCLVAILAGQKNSMALAVHLYWALMEGLETQELAQILMLCGGYQGIDVYAGGLSVLEGTCVLLSKLAAAGTTDTRQVLGGLVQTFRP